MRHRYIITYDIREPKRLRKVYTVMRGYGDHIQYSVFRCDLSLSEKVLMIGDLLNEINCKEDQILIINIGSPEGRGDNCIESLGLTLPPPEKHVFVV